MLTEITLFAKGRVIHAKKGTGIAGIDVNLIDPAPASGEDEVLGSATTGSDGSFAIELDTTKVLRLVESGQRAFFRLLDGDTVLVDEVATPRWSPAEASLRHRVFVSQSDTAVEAPVSEAYEVSGTLVDAKAVPIVGAAIRVRQHVEFGEKEIDLGATATDALGRWRVAYEPETQFKDSDETLIISVEAETEEALVASTGLLITPPRALTIDMETEGEEGSEPDLHAMAMAKANPLLGSKTLRSLSKSAQKLVAAQAGVDGRTMSKLVSADTIAAQDESGTLTRDKVFLALQQGLPADAIAITMKGSDAFEAAMAPLVTKEILTGGEVSALQEQIREVAIQKVIALPDAATPLAEALNAFGIDSPEQIRAVAEAWLDHPDDREAFEEVLEEAFFTEGEITLVRRVTALGNLSNWNVPVMQVLSAELAVDGASLAPLAGKSQSDWVTLIEDITDSGLTDSTAINDYASMLKARVDADIPSDRLKNEIDADSGRSSGLKELLNDEAMADFNFFGERVDEVIAREELTPTNPVKAEARKMQRLGKVASNYEDVKAIEMNGFGSAEAIILTPEVAYDKLLEPANTESHPKAQHKMARQRVLSGIAMAAAMRTNAQSAFLMTPKTVLDSEHAAAVSNLFGEMDACACDGCESVFSPAAYLVDLVSFIQQGIKRTTSGGGGSPLIQDGWTALTNYHRPDLSTVRLNCAGTNTAIPYIDLVNEILERSLPEPSWLYRSTSTGVVEDAFDPMSTGSPPALPTHGDLSAEELAAYPRETWYPALRGLVQSSMRSSFRLPFDRPTEEARLNLDALSVTLADILEATGPNPFQDSALVTKRRDLAGALEEIGFTYAEASPFLSMTPVDAGHAWGGESIIPALFLADMDKIKVEPVLERLGIDVNSLLVALETAYVKRANSELTVTGLTSCSLKDARVVATSETRDGVMEALHRLYRLQRALGWTVREVDLAIRLFDPSGTTLQVTEATFLKLADVQHAARTLRLRPIEVLSFWSSPDGNEGFFVFDEPSAEGEEEVSLFESIFVQGRPPTKLEASLKALPRDPETPSALTDEQVRSILLRLAVMPEDLAALKSVPGQEGAALLAASKKTVWRWYCRSRLARALGMRLADFCFLADQAQDPSSSTTAFTRPYGTGAEGLFGEFIRLAAGWNRVGLRREDYAYLLQHATNTGSSLEESTATTQDFLRTLRSALQEVANRRLPLFAPLSSVSEETLVTELSYFMPHDVARSAAAMLVASETPTGVARALLEEALASVLWSQSVGSTIDAVASTRTSFVADAARQLRMMPGLGLKPSAPFADAFLVVDAVAQPMMEEFTTSAQALLIGTFANALKDGVALPDDTETVDIVDGFFGEGFFNDIDAMPHADTDDRDDRIRTVLRMVEIVRLLKEMAPSQRADFTAALNGPTGLGGDDFTLASSLMTWAVASILSTAASDFETREYRRQATLLGLDTHQRAEAVSLEAVEPLVPEVVGLRLGALSPTAKVAKTNVFLQKLVASDFLTSSPELADTIFLTSLGFSASEAASFQRAPMASSPEDIRVYALRYGAFAARHFAEQLREHEMREVLLDLYAARLRVDREVVSTMLFDSAAGVVSGSGGGELASLYLRSPAFVLTPASPPEFVAAAINTDVRLRKAGALVLSLGLTSAEYLDNEHFASKGLVALRSLPVSATSDITAMLRGVLRVAELKGWTVALRDPKTTTAYVFLKAFLETGMMTRQGLFAPALRWESIESDPFFEDNLDEGAGYAVVSARVQRRLRAEQLQARSELGRRDFVTFGGRFRYTTGDSFTHRLAAARVLRDVGKAKRGEEAWRAFSKPFIDRLREMQRDALVDAHLRSSSTPTREALFGKVLIDVEMSCCMRTTRVLQAITTVQAFVQRTLMNVDATLSFDPDYAERWVWMKSFRLWEANRKIFLYPENWIEPSLRHDKTPLFKQLESELMEKELTEENIERALRNYLRQLDEVARLEVRAFTREQVKSTDEEVLHVVARTPNLPHRYYYRQRRGENRWAPWEPLEVAVEGDTLAMAVIQNRLHLFWVQKQVDGSQGPREIDPTDPQQLEEARNSGRKVVARIQYARREGQEWSPVKQSRDAVVIDMPGFNEQSPLALYVDHAYMPNESLIFPAAVRLFAEFDPNADGVDNGAFLFRSCTGELELVVENSAPGAQPLNRPWGPRGLQAYEDHSVSDALDLILPSSVEGRTGKTVLTRAVHAGPGASEFHVVVDRSVENLRDGRYFAMGDGLLYRDGFTNFYVEVMRCPCAITKAKTVAPERGALGDTKAESTPRGSVSARRTARTSVRVRGPNHRDESSIKLRKDLGDDTVLAQPPEPLKPETRPANATVRVTDLHHHHVCSFLSALEAYGINGLYRPETQFPVLMVGRPSLDDRYDFKSAGAVWAPEYPSADMDFEAYTPNGIYNAEVFFHVPMLIAARLNADQRYGEAMRWMHFIYDPTQVQRPYPAALNLLPLAASSKRASVPYATAWRYRPFFMEEFGSRIDATMRLLFPNIAAEEEPTIDAHRRLLDQLSAWLENPFNPHAVAETRLRSYQLSVLMRYVDNLLDWADTLFLQDTRESVMEALQLYILVAQMLGQRPKRFAPEPSGDAVTLGQVLEAGRNASKTSLPEDASVLEDCCAHFPNVDAAQFLYWRRFCTPPNTQVDAYWDRVADRLFKIRHCMNIDGVSRDLAFFEPPIDPGLLVRAAAAGVDLASALSQGVPTLATWRFQALLQRAVDFAGDVRSLGGQLLAALEKKDAEQLSVLRAEHERVLLEAGRAVRRLQVQEAQQQVTALESSKAMANERLTYYSGLTPTSELEEQATQKTKDAQDKQNTSNWWSLGATASRAIPTIASGFSGWMAHVVVKVGGEIVGETAECLSRYYSLESYNLQSEASLLSTKASYDRRWKEWQLQKNVATHEVTQVEAQQAAASIRLRVTETELANFETQVRNAREVEAVLREKFTNEELYSWMVGQLSALHRASYQLAFDLARRAERAYRFERLEPSATFLSYGHWEGLRKGLLAGERLHHDLRRMEKSYLDTDRREYELTRHFSLTDFDASALVQLRETGVCEFELKESHFDRDYPGQYFRRIKAASITIPAVVGPYGGVHAKLTLLSSAIRRDPQIASGYPKNLPSDARFEHDLVPIQSIVTSGGQSDAGLFQLDLRSERLLPFEGAGAISRWRLELDPETNAFDTRTVSDVVLHLNYTSRDGGERLANAAKAATFESAPPPRQDHILSMAQLAPEALQAFLTGPDKGKLVPGALRPRLGVVPRNVGRAGRSMTVMLVVKEPLEGLSPDDISVDIVVPPSSSALATTTCSDNMPLSNGEAFSVAPQLVAGFTYSGLGTNPIEPLYDSTTWKLDVKRPSGGLEAFLATITDVILIVREDLSAQDD